ncbi:hypothetical protein MPH_04268 [Macrophomina phaseolina MS6]|uniref:Uncharacterized protein n=1 Tax=Macrophomina phaseolina (strain MS6) TaxID=1126212 RepID=K2R7V6_MACPH|nr:hypothetical protein MPH_04268 [Macrophomina phaseolina MS6]
MAFVPDLGVLGTMMPFPELEVPGRRDDSPALLAQDEDVELEELARAVAELSLDEKPPRPTSATAALQTTRKTQVQRESDAADHLEYAEGDRHALDGPQYETAQELYFEAVTARLVDVGSPEDGLERDSWGLVKYVADYEQRCFHQQEKNDSDGSFYTALEDQEQGKELSPTQEEDEMERYDAGGEMEVCYRTSEPEIRPKSRHTRGNMPAQETQIPRYIQVLDEVAFHTQDDHPGVNMEDLMSNFRDFDSERNRKIRAIQVMREQLEDRVLRRESRRLDLVADRYAIEDLQMVVNDLYLYDQFHWPFLDILKYEEDQPGDCDVTGVNLRMNRIDDWNPEFNWAEPFAPRKGRRGARNECVEEAPASPNTRTTGATPAFEPVQDLRPEF